MTDLELDQRILEILPSNDDIVSQEEHLDLDSFLRKSREVAPDYRQVMNAGQGIEVRLQAAFLDFSTSGGNHRELLSARILESESLVIIGPFKHRSRAIEKLISDYRGEHNAHMMLDYLRGTVVVPGRQNILEAVEIQKEEFLSRGFTHVHTKSTFGLPPRSGYRDAKVYFRSKFNPLIVETITLTKPMLEAKELRGGHDNYVRARSLSKSIGLLLAESPPNQDEAARLKSEYDSLISSMSELYSSAWRASGGQR